MATLSIPFKARQLAGHKQVQARQVLEPEIKSRAVQTNVVDAAAVADAKRAPVPQARAVNNRVQLRSRLRKRLQPRCKKTPALHHR